MGTWQVLGIGLAGLAFSAGLAGGAVLTIVLAVVIHRRGEATKRAEFNARVATLVAHYPTAGTSAAAPETATAPPGAPTVLH